MKRTGGEHSRRPSGIDPYARATVNQETDRREKHLARHPGPKEKHLPGDPLLAEARKRTPVPELPRTSRDEDMSKPVLFYGKSSQLTQCLTYVSVKALADGITADRQQSGILASLFRGPALDWLTPTLQSTPKIVDNFNEFVLLIQQDFGLTENAQRHQAVRALKNLQQKGPAQLYAVELKRYTRLLGLDDQTAKSHFIEGLKLHVREALIATQDKGETLDETIEEAIRIDSELYNARRAAGRKQGKQGPGAGVKCYKCGKFGHKRNECKMA